MLDRLNIYKNLRQVFVEDDIEAAKVLFLNGLTEAKDLCRAHNLRMIRNTRPGAGELPIKIEGVTKSNRKIAQLIQSSLHQALESLPEQDLWNVYKNDIVDYLTGPQAIEPNFDNVHQWIARVRESLISEINRNLFNEETELGIFNIASRYANTHIEQLPQQPTGHNNLEERIQGITAESLIRPQQITTENKKTLISSAIFSYEQDNPKAQDLRVASNNPEQMIYLNNIRLESSAVISIASITSAMNKNKQLAPNLSDFYLDTIELINKDFVKEANSNKKLEALIYSATQHKPAFFAVTNNSHWITIGLIPDPTDNNKIIPVYINSNSSSLGKNLLHDIKVMGKKLGINIAETISDTSIGQQVGECCGLATGLNISAFAHFYDDLIHNNIPRKLLEKQDINPDNLHRISRPEEKVNLPELLQKIFPTYISFDPYDRHIKQSSNARSYTNRVGSKVLDLVHKAENNLDNITLDCAKLPISNINIIKKLDEILSHRIEGRLEHEEATKLCMAMAMLPNQISQLYQQEYDEVMAHFAIDNPALGLENKLCKLLSSPNSQRVKRLMFQSMQEAEANGLPHNPPVGAEDNLDLTGLVTRTHPKVSALLLDSALEIRNIERDDLMIFNLNISEVMRSIWHFFNYLMSFITGYQTNTELKAEISEALREIHDLARRNQDIEFDPNQIQQNTQSHVNRLLEKRNELNRGFLAIE